MDGIIEFYPEQLFKMTWLQPCCPIWQELLIVKTFGCSPPPKNERPQQQAISRVLMQNYWIFISHKNFVRSRDVYDRSWFESSIFAIDREKCVLQNMICPRWWLDQILSGSNWFVAFHSRNLVLSRIWLDLLDLLRNHHGQHCCPPFRSYTTLGP
jgi:hypothetical protein